MFMKIASSLCVFLFSFCNLFAQLPHDICEGAVPVTWKAKQGSIEMSDAHFKRGNQSVKWHWKSGGELRITDTALQTVAANPRSTFVVWIYNKKPLKDSLVFRFGNGSKTAASFSLRLNFRGWRTAWVMYHRDMKGKPFAGLNTLTVQPPRTAKSGTLFFDQVLFNVDINPRSPMQDEQVPSVNKDNEKAANAHWTALYRFSHTPHWLTLPKKLTNADVQAIQTISNRFETYIFPTAKKLSLKQIEKQFAFWNIRRANGSITGRTVYSVNDNELMHEGKSTAGKNALKEENIKAYTELMLKVASAYRAATDTTEKARIGELFLLMLHHLEDQGWAAGSGMGALHHLGYNFRDYYTACLLMKPLLKKENILQRTIQSMAWFSGLGRTWAKPDSLTDSNIDVFNTLLNGMLSTILMMDDSPEKVRQLQEFSAWLSKTLEPTFSIDGTFKPDGSVVHHGNLYPAYGVGGLEGVAPIIYALSQTPFRVNAKGHQTVRHVLMMMHRYTNPVRWPISVSGRHPTGNWRITDEAFAYIALAGTADGSRAMDDSMAAVYLLINPASKNDFNEKFDGIKPASFPNGHWDLNYGLLSIHRRSNWLMTVRGHNRYFTTHEAYPGANVFGRYLSYGHLEVLLPQTGQSSGSHFKDEGWDWTGIPGTTTLKVPLDSLRARIINADDYSGVEEMLLSDEIFAGGINFNQQQGLFAMKLRGHDKYNMGSFRATKSWFMFDSLVVCLGSNISNNISSAPTITTIFQNVLDSSSSKFIFNGESTTAFPLQKSWNDKKPLTIIDNRGIGYYLPASENVFFTKKEQTSRNQQDTKSTTGKVAMLQIEHGISPQGKSYNYAMLIGASPEKMEQLAYAQKISVTYKVLQQDSVAHIVHCAPLKLTGLALFQESQRTNDTLILKNNRPCLLMYKPMNGGISLSVVDPDLAFYSGPDDSPLTADGKRKEVSIYSRKWYKTPAKPSVVELMVKGKWYVKKNPVHSAIITPDGNTKLSVNCGYGKTSVVKLFLK